MATIPSIPILRRGKVYRSLDQSDIAPIGGGEPVARVSMANSGLVKRDLLGLRQAREALKPIPSNRLLEMAVHAGEIFLKDTLPVGEEELPQTPEDYVKALSATSGLPHSLIRMNMNRLADVFAQMPTILKGLTRGLDLSVLDRGFGEQQGVPVGYSVQTDALSVILPSNSPAVNALWVPSIVMKVPVILKPGREEPWTPWRVIQAFIKAGCPREAFSFYPTDHEGSGAIMRKAGRVMIFGDEATVAQYKHDPRVEVHGPGRSKILLGEDACDQWEDYLDLMVESISANSGRSCINASAILTPRHGKEIAQAVAQKLAAIRPRRFDDPEARLAGFANPQFAEYIDNAITEGLKEPGANDMSLPLHGGERHMILDKMHYLQPTIIHCQSFEHGLANREFLFPFASVTEVPQSQMLDLIGPSLVVTAITNDELWRERLLASPDIERLNLGPCPTNRVKWDQPHEGNLFEFLYKRRAIFLAA